MVCILRRGPGPVVLYMATLIKYPYGVVLFSFLLVVFYFWLWTRIRQWENFTYRRRPCSAIDRKRANFLTNSWIVFDGLMQTRRNPNVSTLELHPVCIRPSICPCSSRFLHSYWGRRMIGQLYHCSSVNKVTRRNMGDNRQEAKHN